MYYGKHKDLKTTGFRDSHRVFANGNTTSSTIMPSYKPKKE